MIQAHTNAWYDRLSETQSRYYYPWRSSLSPNHGEDTFLSLLKHELTREDTVLDAGCGSGELTNNIAQYCKIIYGYDRVKRFIDWARKDKHPNATFLWYDSKQSGTVKLPLEGRCIDYFISSKGPLHWILDAPRIAKPNANIIMLVPYSGMNDGWNALLPMDLQHHGPTKEEILNRLETRLTSIGLKIDQVEVFETQEIFHDPIEFRKFLTWGKFDAHYDGNALIKTIDMIFAHYGTGNTLAVSYNRFIWRSHIHHTASHAPLKDTCSQCATRT